MSRLTELPLFQIAVATLASQAQLPSDLIARNLIPAPRRGTPHFADLFRI
ncbi:hypothetical protein Poly41_70990 [Novipirellula artificiosorum]|uniref:Uncharacterized protein n=1 Tax=Novipirellula artificiosorum TaxID=2528016 RepID=A0A5C6CHL0_9BACT|nr:hypothetical protein Poly41_70990 [Novipirellula artificiosorum]